MDKYLTWMTSALALTVGMVVGAVVYAWWLHRAALAQRRVPRQSRIVNRVIVNSREKRVWRWLLATFAEHQVMVKMPVTRFTMPLAESDREQWFALLSDVYCTFSVVTPEGKVIGCVDVPGPNGIPASNLTVKRKLFARCGLPHWVVDPEKLPRDQDIYSAFVSGLEEFEAQTDAVSAAVTAVDLDRARVELQAAVSRRRSSQGGTRSPNSGAEDSQFLDSVLATDWAPDSFNAPLDSRAANLS